MIFGILKESEDERRVVMLPEEVETLIKSGHSVLVENKASEGCNYPDKKYSDVGAKLVGKKEIFDSAEFVLKINLPTKEETSLLKNGQFFMSILQPVINSTLIQELSEKKVTVFSLDAIPRITRGQSMDVLSSQSTIAGYKAVLLAAGLYPRFFPMLTTAAGTIAPAKMLIIGAGVAGLQAIATARRLGAVVEVFDTRPEVKEQVQSLGGRFVEVEGAADATKAGGYAVEQSEDYKKRQKEAIHKSAIKSDIIITTALIPGKKAPVLITKEMIKEMRPGSVIIDLASVMGGNCELTQDKKTILENGVTIVGDSNLQGTVPIDASKMFGKNILNFLKNMTKDGKIQLNLEDEIVSGTCISHNGQIRHAPTLEALKK
ncbi:MAG: Re/Si-specific NAD(P)(+) transhydrogenase subunit alpha [Leptospiraceae bacterium]|nr:Re/Si-specific NAD(P)(+) transhydrogenase subunit alpha [Leptospiraceae bacterium]MCK6381263.1 Re/Si-specific NAD(P)(+) transhydrogenase subunit alpha [Leptospiraceae bacterium]NUM42640.1 Re/Si-specific NAD(P)(+) transhydrogenase subunit alpha [Leptospiraceae bacterium]